MESQDTILSIQTTLTNIFMKIEMDKINRDDLGYYYSTDFYTTMCEIKRLQKLSETTKWFQIRQSTIAPNFKWARGLWLNPDYGDVQNAWHIYNNGSILFHNQYSLRRGLSSGFELMQKYKKWYTSILNLPQRTNLLKDVVKLLPDNIIFDNHRCSIPFIAPVSGFETSERIYLKYTAHSTINVCGRIEILMKYSSSRMTIYEEQYSFLRPIKIPTEICVPIEYLVFRFQPKWNNWIHSIL